MPMEFRLIFKTTVSTDLLILGAGLAGASLACFLGYLFTCVAKTSIRILTLRRRLDVNYHKY